MEKMTNAQMFEALKEYVRGTEREQEFIEFLDKRIELSLKKKNTLTKAQKENAEIVENIYEYMVEVNGPVTIADVMQKFELSSNQKASALMKKLVDAKRVVRGKDGKKAVYTAVTVDNAE